MAGARNGPPPHSAERTKDVVVVGAGFSGMYQLYKLREQGLDVQVFEAGSDVGGTWYWNRYPGARVDIESMAYSFSFSEELQQEWEWSEKYSPQPELLKYAQHIADRFDLKNHIAFNTRVASAHFDEDEDEWLVTTECGRRIRAQHLVMATGVLSASKGARYCRTREHYQGRYLPNRFMAKRRCRLLPASGSQSLEQGRRPCKRFH